MEKNRKIANQKKEDFDNKKLKGISPNAFLNVKIFKS